MTIGTREAANILGVTPSRIHQLIKAKHLTAVYRLGRWEVDKKSVLARKAARTITP